MLRESGATEVHLRISSPPFQWPCFYGIDTPDRSELLASIKTLPEICEFLDVDSLEYLSLDHLVQAIDAPGAGFCNACLTGEYPVPVHVPVDFSHRAGTPVASTVTTTVAPEPAELSGAVSGTQA
jgi:amidophosphoribosyltransferase